MTPLNAEQWRRVNELFMEALDLAPEDRASLLAREPALRGEVASLLDSHEEADDFLEKSPASQVARAVLIMSAPAYYKDGEIIDDFRIIRKLGQGAFAIVYLAHQISLDRRVALKISPNIGREARNMAHLEHDNIVKVYSEAVDVERDTRRLCMQWVPGLSLEAALTELEKRPAGTVDGAAILDIADRAAGEDATFTPAAMKDRERLSRLSGVQAAVWMTARLADALAYAHARGVLHLDVKPGNILLSPYGRPLLTDFNVAADRRAEDECILGGTARYMPPEQQKLFDGGDATLNRAGIDERSDVYALGVVLKEMVERFTGEPMESIDFPCLGEVVARCMSLDPKERYQSAQELARTLEGCLEHGEIQRALPAPGPIVKLTERMPVTSILCFTLLPHILGSAVNISYNSMHIVSDLTVAQQKVFHTLVFLYNGIIYPVCIMLYYRLLSPMVRLLRDPHAATRRYDGRSLEERGRCVLMLPLGLVFVTTLGWMPGSIFFPLLIHLKQGPLDPSVFGHFFISFTVSWLVASAYSFLYIEYIALRLLYPKLCLGQYGIRRAAQRQLAGIAPGMRMLHYTAGFAPLIGAAIIVYVGPSPESYRAYRLLIMLLIVSGIAGLLVAIRGSAIVNRTVAALTGGDYAAGMAPLAGAALFLTVGPMPEYYASHRPLIAILIGLGVLGVIVSFRWALLMKRTLGALTGAGRVLK